MLPRLYFLDGRTATALDNLRPILLGHGQRSISQTNGAPDQGQEPYRGHLKRVSATYAKAKSIKDKPFVIRKIQVGNGPLFYRPKSVANVQINY